MIKYEVENIIKTPKLENTQFGGKIEDVLKKVIYERFTSKKAQEEIFKEAEDAFTNRVDDINSPVGLWQGEFWGKLILGACRFCKYTGDENLKKFISKSVKRVIGFQDDDGYIGSYKNKDQVYRSLYKNGRKKVGWDCDWTWNVWCRKYTLWGLLEAYDLLNDDTILNSAIKFTDQLIDMLESIGAKICETGTFFGLPSGSILKPMLVLYRYTENKKYLDFALEIAKEWEDSDTCCAKIVKNSLEKKPIHLWNDELYEITPKSKNNPFSDGESYDIVCSETSNKAYEMMSCFDGLLELYRITGDIKYLNASINFHELLIKYEYNTLFSVGFNDVFINASKYQNSITELCDVIHFMRLSTELFKLTGNAKYLDYTELAFYNPFLAGVTRDGTWGARGIRPMESHMFDMGQAGLKYNHCCTNNIPRGFMNVAEMIAMYDNSNVYVNFYSKANVLIALNETEKVEISIDGDYLQTCSADIKIEANVLNERFLLLRIPSWSKNTTIEYDNKVVSIEKTGFYALPIINGVKNYTIHFDNRPRLSVGKYNYNFYPTTPYLMERYFHFKEVNFNLVHRDIVLTENKATLCVGPILMAMSNEFGNWQEKIDKINQLSDYSIKIKPAENIKYLSSYDVYFIGNDKTEVIRVCDFASASNIIEFDSYRYSVFI